MPDRVETCYTHLLTEIRKAADRSQGVFPGMEPEPDAPQGQEMLL